jgi:hypothetical protein
MSRLREERGSAAIETALVIGVVLTIAIGAFEWGMALKDWITVTAASREGARIGGALGDEPDADCMILEAAAGALQDIGNNQITRLRIYESDASGAVGASQLYRPKVDTDLPSALNCNRWVRIQNGWPETSRDNDGTTRDWIGVAVEFDHDWHTGFLWFSGSVCDRGAGGQTCWSQSTVMRVEPDPTP